MEEFLPLTPVLILGTFWWWVFFATFSAIFIWCIEEDAFRWLSACTVVVVLASVLFGGLGIWAWTNPIKSIEVVLVFVAIGIVWGIVKWQFFLSGRRDRYFELLGEFLLANEREPKQKTVPDDLKDAWLNVKLHYHSVVSVRPYASEHKARITVWMMFWPWSLLWTLLDDVIKNFWKWVVTRITGLLDAMGDRTFRDVEESKNSP